MIKVQIHTDTATVTAECLSILDNNGYSNVEYETFQGMSLINVNVDNTNDADNIEDILMDTHCDVEW